MAAAEHNQDTYYVPHHAHWPIVASLGLVCFLSGIANILHHRWYGSWMLFLGMIALTVMFFGWFGEVIAENQKGYYNHQVEHSFRWGMIWFIFSEVCFFGAFFGALFYTRVLVVPFIGGIHGDPITNYILWPNFKAAWPLLVNPDNALYVGAKEYMKPWGLPAINTALLLTSGVTLTWAHWGIKENNRFKLCFGLFLTVLLGIAFLTCQAHEYSEAYKHMGLNLSAGIYGTTFFMLTGFHGAHVTFGTIMLIVILCRSLAGHFTPENHFAFEGVAWYWHFVDVVWLFLFIFVYWL